uniref:CENP-C n=1 Tax=Aegilops tauschii subsp. strangulata TaxID=200361 RepID=A0A453F212_AEGTS
CLCKDEPIHPPEIPPDAHNQSHIQDEDVEKQAVDISHELPLSKGGKQNAVQKRKNKKQSAKRGKRVSDKPIHTSEIPPEDIVPQNNSHVHEGNFEKPAVGTSNELSPSKDSKQKRVQNEESKKQPLKRMKRGAEEASNPLGIPPENCDTETQPSMQDTNIEQQTVDTRVSRSPNKGKLQKEGQRRKKRQEVNRRKSLTAFGLAWQSGVRRSTRIRSRPLQDWLGERLLYGRIHDTMATVIGVKSYSPSQDGKVELRVKSFVPEQYSDMVAQAAKY